MDLYKLGLGQICYHLSELWIASLIYPGLGFSYH